jgi:asparagine synthase (glutamine-hydrolysing)
MCGITGFINLNKKLADIQILKSMTDVIAHRGPDGEGHWVQENIAIGHRRLSIIDLSSAGKQPMISSDNRFILSYNGEIYNFKEIRDELKQLGYTFKSDTDSEVVLYALAYWGEEALIRFNGMFALAFWDNKKKKMLLARDRYGIKPLYYAMQNNIFCFGSEQKAILKNPAVKNNIDNAGLIEYFTFQNIFSNRTLIEDIKLLPAGHHASIDLDHKNPNLNIKEYWDYNFEEPSHKIDTLEYTEELNRLFINAVDRQLISDVEIGAYLSGGMDSGAITAIAAGKIPNLKSFTCGFDLSSASGVELAFDERERAEAMSAKFKTEHYNIVLKSGDMERCINDLVYTLEEPRVGQSYPNYYAAKLASKFVKVVLSGAGGDELFAGYPWRYYRNINNSDFDSYVDNYYSYWQRLLSNKEFKNVFNNLVSDDYDGSYTRDIFSNIFPKKNIKLTRPEDYINHSLYLESKTFLHGLFVIEDKISMSHGLETRVPFMDNDLVDFAMRCPVSLKLNNIQNVINVDENALGKKTSEYFQKTNDGKQILRNMMSKHIPNEIVTAPKKGFSSPDASWFKGESIEFVKKKLLDPKAKIYELLDYDAVEKMLNEHFDGHQNRRLLIWSLLNTQTYLEQQTQDNLNNK